MRPTISQAAIDSLYQLYTHGATLEAIASVCGVTREAIRMRFKRRSRPSRQAGRSRQPPPDDLACVIAKAVKDKTQKRLVAASYGVCYQTLHDWLLEAGLPTKWSFSRARTDCLTAEMHRVYMASWWLSMRDMEDAYGMSQASISRRFKRAGLPTKEGPGKGRRHRTNTVTCDTTKVGGTI